MAAKLKPNELQIIRIYDAPVKAVWNAWVDPEQVGKWWGPRGFTLTTKSKDVRPGGRWVYTMHGPDGVDYPNDTLFHEVEKYSRLVYDHGASEGKPPLFRVTVNFTELGKNKTKMDMIMAMPSEELLKSTKKFIKQAGGNATWDRLAEHLAEESGQKKFVINRSFDVPLATMFEVWTNPEHVAKWMPPTGFDMTFLKAEIKPGGHSFYFMSNGAGMKMYGRASYLEVTKPNRIVYTQQFCDEKGRVARHPMAPTWPETMLTTVTLSEEGPAQTRVTIEWEVHGHATREEMETFLNGRAGMTMGWTGSFDKLEDYLAKL